MKINNKKGSVLMLALLFSFITIATAIPVYKSAMLHFKKTAGSGSGAYYIAIAGLRYAALLLEAPEAYSIDTDPNTAEIYTVTGQELNGDFFADMGIDPNDPKLSITIQVQEDGQFEIKAKYSS